MPESLIEVKDLYKQYENDGVVTKVLFDLSFKIYRGEFVALMGPSGSGKSTLMHILGFLDRLTSGQYFFKGDDVSKLDDDRLAIMRRHEVGFVFQAFNLLPRTSVLENVLLPTIYTDVSQKKRTEKAQEVLEKVGLSHRLEHLSNQLSGGEKQRVSIARALMNDPALIFADEPTGNLDSKSTIAILEILQQLNRDGKTIVMVTHEPELTPYTTRIMKLFDGRIESDKPGPFKDVRTEPPAAYARNIKSQETHEAEGFT